MDDQQQCLEPLLQITGSINIWLSTLSSTRALSIRFRFKKAQSYELKMFLNILQRGPTPPQRSYELNQLHALYIQLQCKSHWRQQWTRCGQSVPISQHKFVTLQKALRYQPSHGIFTLRLPTPSKTKIWILETSYKEILILSIIRISTIKRERWLQQLSKNVQPPSNIEHS